MSSWLLAPGHGLVALLLFHHCELNVIIYKEVFVINHEYISANYLPRLHGTLNSTYNEVSFNEKLPITKENLCTKYTLLPINTLPLMKSRL